MVLAVRMQFGQYGSELARAPGMSSPLLSKTQTQGWALAVLRRRR